MAPAGLKAVVGESECERAAGGCWAEDIYTGDGEEGMGTGGG